MGTTGQSNRIKAASKQRGVGALGLIVGLSILAAFVSFGLSALPMYVNNMTMMDIAQDVVAEPEMKKKSVRQIRQSITDRFSMNSLWDLDPNEVIKITKSVGESPVITIDYEDRRPLFYNIELVTNFNKEFSSP